MKRGQTTPVTRFANSAGDELNATISPDQRWIAYTALQSGSRDVYVSPFPTPTSRTVVSITGGAQPVWSGEGRTLSYVTPDGAFVSVAFTPGSPPSFGPPRELYRRIFARCWTLSPDGTKLIIIDTSALLKLRGLEVVVRFAPAFERERDQPRQPGVTSTAVGSAPREVAYFPWTPPLCAGRGI